MTNTVISYPIPIYQNLPIQAQFYQPSLFFISNIILGLVTTVQTTEDVNYTVGQEIRLLIPPSFGSYQLNGKTAFVIDIPSTNQVILNLDSSSNVDTYIASTNATQSAQIVAVGDINNGNISVNGARNVPTNVLGSFINISPE